MGNAQGRGHIAASGGAYGGAPAEARQAYDKLVRHNLSGLARTSAQAALWLARGGAPGLPPGCDALVARLVGHFADNYTPTMSASTNVAKPIVEFVMSDEGMGWVDALGMEVVVTVSAVAAMPFLPERDGPALSFVVRALESPLEWVVSPAGTILAAFDSFAEEKKLTYTDLNRLVAHFTARGLAGGDRDEHGIKALAKWGADVDGTFTDLQNRAQSGAAELWAAPTPRAAPRDAGLAEE